MTSEKFEETNSYDFEAKIQISRILKILSETIRNAEIVLCLPLALHTDCTTLKEHFPPDQVKFIKDTCRKTSVKLTREWASEDVEPNLHSDMCLVIDLLLSVPQFADFCRSNIIEDISPAGKALLRNLEELRLCVSQRLKVTPKQEAKQEAELRCLYQQNIRNREEVQKLTEKLKKLTTETDQEIEDKKQLIKQQIEKITKVRKQCKDSVKKKM